MCSWKSPGKSSGIEVMEMFMHVYKYRLKKLLRTKEMIFWTLAFPILLSVFFHLAFQNLDRAEAFDPIATAVVADENYRSSDFFKEVLTEVSQGEEPLLTYREVTKEEAEKLLETGEIYGFFLVDDPISMTVKTSGLSQNILRLFLDQVNQRSRMIQDISSVSPESMPLFLEALNESVTYAVEKEKTTAPPSQILNYFYSLIAMACMYGAFFGSDEITDIEANISMRAARIQVAPVHKLKAFAASSLASYSVLLVNTSILLLFLSYVLGIDFGERAFYIVLTAFAGTLTGITFGSFISSLVKKNENMKAAVIVAVTMGGSFLAGMMYAQMKYFVYDKAPILAYLNPVNLITDSFYSLYYFTDMGRYFLNLAILMVMTVLFGLGTYFVLRRRRYASI